MRDKVAVRPKSHANEERSGASSAESSNGKPAKKTYRRKFYECPLAGCGRKFDREERLEKHVKIHRTESMAVIEGRPGLCKRCYQPRDLLTPDDLCIRCRQSIAETKEEGRNSTLALIAAINNHAVERAQRLSTYFNTYCTYHNVHGAQSVERMSVLPSLMGADFHSSSLLRAAVDTLTHAHFAQLTKLPYLAQSAQTWYGVLLRTLADAMTKAGNSAVQRAAFPFSDREILIGLMLLSLLASFDNPLPISDKNEYFMIHYTGGRQYLNARGPSCLDTGSRVDRSIYTGLYSSSLLLEISGTEKKYAVSFDNPEWQEDQFAISTGGEDFYSQEVDFLNTIKPLGRILDAVDAVVNSKDPFDQRLYDTLVERIQKAERFLPRDDDFPTVAVTDESMFDFTIEEQCFIFDSPVITRFCKYPGPDVARDVLLTGMICLVLNCSLLRFSLCLQAPPSVARPERIRALKARVRQIAKDLCQGAWYESTLPSLAYAKFIVIFVRMAQAVFEDIGEEAEAEYGWTQACLVATRLRMRRLRSRGVLTLCCAEQLEQGMQRRCRFRPRRKSVGDPGGCPFPQ